MIDSYTLVIPTYNRSALLRRLVRYYRKRAPFINLLVLDSSRSEVQEENVKALSQYGSAVRHVVYADNIQASSKLADGLALVETEYASLCADDDVVFPEALAESLMFLESHPDYACAHGLYLNFRQAGNDIHVFSEYSGPSNEAIHPGARVFRLLQRYESLYYGAFRTNDLREIVTVMQAMPSPLFRELFQSVATVIKGKVKRFPSVYAARQSGPPADPNREKWQTCYWFADNPREVLEHYERYCDTLWKFYEDRASQRVERAAFFKTLDLAHAVYFSAGCSADYFCSVLQRYWPGDGLANVGDANLLVELGAPTAFTASSINKLLIRSWLLVRAVWSTPAVWRLDSEVRRACTKPWKCHLSGSLRWLASAPEFRAGYLDLCNYLDAG